MSNKLTVGKAIAAGIRRLQLHALTLVKNACGSSLTGAPSCRNFWHLPEQEAIQIQTDAPPREIVQVVEHLTKQTKMNNQTIVQPYLFFDGKCEEAIEFYQRALGAQINMQMRFKDSPKPPPPGCAPPAPEKIMHAQIQIGETVVMLSDGRCTGQPKFEGFSLSLTVRTGADADRAFSALADGGQVQMPLAKTFFSARFGMVVDRFGVMWMVLVRPGENLPPQHK